MQRRTVSVGDFPRGEEDTPWRLRTGRVDRADRSPTIGAGMRAVALGRKDRGERVGNRRQLGVDLVDLTRGLRGLRARGHRRRRRRGRWWRRERWWRRCLDRFVRRVGRRIGHRLRRVLGGEVLDLVAGWRLGQRGREAARRRRGRVLQAREGHVEPLEVVVEIRGGRRLNRRRRGWRRGRRTDRRALPALPHQQLLDAADHQLRLERLGQHAVAPDFGGAHLIDRLEGTGQEHHRNVRQPRRLLDVLRHLVAVAARHPDIRKHDVGRRRLESLDRQVAVADGDDLDVLVREGQLDDALNGDAVVGQEQRVRHGYTRARAWLLMKVMMSCIGVPGKKMPLTPIALSFGMSTSGMMPPITTSTSSRPFSVRSCMSRGAM